jgi:transcriptional regulator with XRE-family HTH domain
MKDVFAERLKQERTRAKLSQDDIADACVNRGGQPVTKQTVSLWEKPGGNKPSFENLVFLSKKLRVSIDYLVGLTDKKDSTTSSPPIQAENLADVIRIFEEMIPVDIRIPPLEKSRIIEGMYKRVRPDGTIPTAEVVELIKPIKDRYVRWDDESRGRKVSKGAYNRRPKQR